MIAFFTKPMEPAQIALWATTQPVVDEVSRPAWVRGPFWHALMPSPAWESNGHMIMVDVQRWEDDCDWLHISITPKKRGAPKAQFVHRVIGWFCPPDKPVISVIRATDGESLTQKDNMLHLWVRLGEGRPVPFFPGYKTSVAVDL